MKNARLFAPSHPLSGEVELPISKSIANRQLIISALQGTILDFGETNIPSDVRILQNCLTNYARIINVGMSGTAMRFLTAFLSIRDGEMYKIKGSERMGKRPMAPLISALNSIGANIEYLKNEGFLPLCINGKIICGGDVTIDSTISSQFISALMLIAPYMKNGLRINTISERISEPYILLTAACMRKGGVEVSISDTSILIGAGNYCETTFEMEADWSAASYFYGFVAVIPNSKLFLKGLKLPSIQGDSILAEWFSKMGVKTKVCSNGVEISSNEKVNLPAEMDFRNNPDLAQTFAFLAATLGQDLKLTGLNNLRIKETNRVAAMQKELEKLGLNISVYGNTLQIKKTVPKTEIVIKTYNDHRMAMSAAILWCHADKNAQMVLPEIEDALVVEKSFPAFWNQLNQIGLHNIISS